METSSERGPTNSKVVALLVFLMHQVIAVGIVFPTAVTAVGIGVAFPAMVGVGIHRSFVSSLSHPPYFPAETVWAFFLGWSLGGFLRHRTMLWVWVVPSVVLGYLYFQFPNCPVDFFRNGCLDSPSAYSLFFGRDCIPGGSCQYQLLFTYPFFAAVGYSAGALLAQRMNRLSKYTDTMRDINVGRASMVGGAFVCFALLAAWRYIPHNFPFPIWYTGLLFLFQFAIDFAVVTYVFMVVIGLVGRRFALTRWFLNETLPMVAAEPDG
jgi:hypothetical protein